jgi:hypothetical protein
MAVAAASHAAASVIRVEPDGHSLLPSGPYTYLPARTKAALAVCAAVALRRMREYAQHAPHAYLPSYVRTCVCTHTYTHAHTR